MIFMALLGLMTFFLAVMAADCNRFVIRTYSLKIQKLRGKRRLLLLSDLHNKSFGKKNQRLLDAIRQIDPDMILIAGDMYTSQKNGDTTVAGELVCSLAEQYPVYYGNGNHEDKTRRCPDLFGSMYEDFVRRIKGAGVRHLVNEKVCIPEFNMDIYGLEISRRYYGKFNYAQMDESYLESLLGKPSSSRVNVLIAHNPDYFEAYAGWGADLVVSGHVHGGLMRLPVLGGVISPALRLFPKYDGGEFHQGNAALILGRGLGTHTLPIRIFNPGELVVIEIN